MGQIRFRRGLEADRDDIIPRAGEPLYTTDTKKMYVGDGTTPGGIVVGIGETGEGVPTGGTSGQVLAKASATDYDTEWVDQSGGSGAVDSVNSQTGTVVLDADDIDDTSTTHKFVTASDVTKLGNLSGTNTGDQDLSGYATTAAVAAGYQPLDADLTALAALTSPATKLDGIEANADVTDTTNVTAAGALMDSEVANLAAVKAFDPTDYATAAQGALADTATQPGDLATVATTGAYSDLSGTPTVPTSVDSLNPSQTGNSGKFLKTNGTNASWEAIPGGGDALTSNPLSQFASTTSSQLRGVLSDETGTGAAVFGTSPNITTPTGIVKGDVGLGNVDNTSDATKLAATLAAVYPVGSIYTATVATNPATLFGFGTWTAYGAGRVIVGKASSGTFGTAGATGGAETHTLSISEMPSHSHSLKVGSATGNGVTPTAGRGAGFGGYVQDQGGGAAHNNLQPYIVAYVWERTA